MNQNDFNNMTPERLEIFISCQRESTELEVMLAKRLVELEQDNGIEWESNFQSELDTAIQEVDGLEGKIEDLEDIIGDIKFAAENANTPEESEAAIVDILELVNK